MGTETRTGPTPGPWQIFAGYGHEYIYDPDGRTEYASDSIAVAYQNSRTDKATSKANARLIVAASNAMQSAAAGLGVDPVELAEALANGGVAELVECLTGCTSCAPQLLNMPIGKRSGAALASIPAGKGGGA